MASSHHRPKSTAVPMPAANTQPNRFIGRPVKSIGATPGRFNAAS